MTCDLELAALLSQPWNEGACRGYVDRRHGAVRLQTRRY